MGKLRVLSHTFLNRILTYLFADILMHGRFDTFYTRRLYEKLVKFELSYSIS